MEKAYININGFLGGKGCDIFPSRLNPPFNLRNVSVVVFTASVVA